MHRHMEDIVVVINEGTVTHSRYEQCDMFIPQGKMEGGHLGRTICKRGDEINRHCLAATSARVAEGVWLQSREQVLLNVDTFK